MIKMDMVKAYDQLEWSFLMQVVKAFGLYTQWKWLIFNSILTTHLSILMNGATCDYIKSSWGLYQRNHLSPYIFILTKEILCRILNQVFSIGHIKPFIIASGCLVITHLLYANNLVIFLNDSKLSLQVCSKILKDYAGFLS